MTTTTTITRPPERIAAATSVCGSRSCRQLIEPGHLIVKRARGGWKHADCTRPVRVCRNRRQA
jgi:hypothetical protein